MKSPKVLHGLLKPHLVNNECCSVKLVKFDVMMKTVIFVKITNSFLNIRESVGILLNHLSYYLC